MRSLGAYCAVLNMFFVVLDHPPTVQTPPAEPQKPASTPSAEETVTTTLAVATISESPITTTTATAPNAAAASTEAIQEKKSE